MVTNGSSSSVPFSITRIVPPISPTNRRPSGANYIAVGPCRPVANCESWKLPGTVEARDAGVHRTKIDNSPAKRALAATRAILRPINEPSILSLSLLALMGRVAGQTHSPVTLREEA